MHEMALCESIVSSLQQAAEREHYSRIHKVHLEIGALAAVETEALLFCYDAVSRGTIAEGSELLIKTIDATAWCLECADVVVIQARYQPCPVCESWHLQVTGGDDLKIKELEVE